MLIGIPRGLVWNSIQRRPSRKATARLLRGSYQEDSPRYKRRRNRRLSSKPDTIAMLEVYDAANTMEHLKIVGSLDSDRLGIKYVRNVSYT